MAKFTEVANSNTLSFAKVKMDVNHALDFLMENFVQEGNINNPFNITDDNLPKWTKTHTNLEN